jgi:hypothetical protein
MSLSDRFLYCIPRGGLNDVLVQIYKCLMYAKHSKRKLVIDTRQCFLNDNLCNYIDIQDPCIYKGALNEWYTLTKNSSVYPPELKELKIYQQNM